MATLANGLGVQQRGWLGGGGGSLPELFRTIPVSSGSSWHKIAPFAGPGFFITVGCMNPGNSVTDIAGGSAFGYTLLFVILLFFVILLSNLTAIILQTPAFDRSRERRRDTAKWATIDSAAAPMLALFVTAATLIVAAAFHASGRTEVAEIQDAHQLLTSPPGAALASTVFAIALIAAGRIPRSAPPWRPRS